MRKWYFPVPEGQSFGSATYSRPRPEPRNQSIAAGATPVRGPPGYAGGVQPYGSSPGWVCQSNIRPGEPEVTRKPSMWWVLRVLAYFPPGSQRIVPCLSRSEEHTSEL